MLGHTTNQQLLLELNELVVGHERAKKLLITLVNRSKKAHREKYMDMEGLYTSIEKMNLLLIGASGTGKTHLLESLQQVAHFPLIKIDASRLNPAANMSYSYKDIEKAIRENARKLVKDPSMPYFSQQGTIDQTIVFLDEMDKLCTPYGKNDGWHSRTQSELLTLIENQEEFKDVSFVFAGAFTSLRQKEKSSSIGFSSGDVGVYSSRETISEDDLQEYGMATELLGRVSVVCELDVLTYESMAYILNNLILPNKVRDLSYFIDNPGSIVTEDMKADIITESLNSGQGVRYLKRAVNNLFLDLEFNYELNQ